MEKYFTILPTIQTKNDFLVSSTVYKEDLFNCITKDYSDVYECTPCDWVTVRKNAKYEEGNPSDIESYCMTDMFMHYIGKWYDVNVIYYLAGNGVNIHSSYERALHFAIKLGKIETIKCLAKLGSNLGVGLEEVVNNNNLNVLKCFIELGADVNAEYGIALRTAVENGRLDMVEYLVEKGANIHVRNDYALRTAVENGRLDMVEYLVEKGADIHVDDDYALRRSSKYGRLQIVKYLVEQGADIHACDDYALRWAAMDGYLEIVKYLVEKGADIHSQNDFALRHAAENGHLDVVEYLKSLK